MYELRFDPQAPTDKYYYALTMFPYPSGYGLHVGHASTFTINDVVARFMRMQWYHVLNPFGFDSFGLPTENYAMKQGKPAYQVTKENGAHFLKQIRALEMSFDMDRVFYTSDPSYYKWTQRLFAELFTQGLVYRDELWVNWCPDCQTVLANDQVVDGACERCGAEIIQKKMPQWFINITAYADRLLEDLDTVDWPEATKIAQKNWIGRSEGAEISFVVADHDVTLDVFTSRPDTLFGVTALMVAPEHTLLDDILPDDAREEVMRYRQQTLAKTAVQRQQDLKDKTGVFSGLYALHPLTGAQVPIWYADYVLADYGSGAVMFVPAHDERDWEFAHNMQLPIVQVIDSPDYVVDTVYTWFGVLINSDEFTGMSTDVALSKIVEKLQSLGKGRPKVNYKLRDWSVSRQRYWGSPIPIYYDEHDQPHLIPADELPVELPLDVENYTPKGTSPLADHASFSTYVAKDGTTYRRECDTLDTFMCSSFYFLRFLSPHASDVLFEKDLADALLPVDLYTWGKEHTVGHLLYARFIHKFLYDQWYVSTPEPFAKLVHQGMVQGSDGRKMGKRYGNVIDPLDVIDQYDADTLRTYLLFMWPVEADKNWNNDALAGVHRFLQKVEKMSACVVSDETVDEQRDTLVLLHKTIQGVTADIEKLKCNTVVSKLMIFANHVLDVGSLTARSFCIYLQLLAPLAPVLSERLWKTHVEMVPDLVVSVPSAHDVAGASWSIHYSPWPRFDATLIQDERVTLPVQINGKRRYEVDVPSDISEHDLLDVVYEHDYWQKNYGDLRARKVIYVPRKIINLVVTS